jgi:hypothetical protein
MITFNYLVRKKADVSAEDFKGYWMGEHAGNCLQVAGKLGIGKYTKCETLHEDDVNKLLQQMYGTAADAYDFVDQMVIGDLANFKKGLADSEVQAALKAMHETESAYVDFSGSDYWFTIDLPQIFPREDVTATWNNTNLKIFYVPRRHQNLSLTEAQLHWNSCHGALARQFSQFLPFMKYIQGHRIKSKVADEFKALLGADFENIDAMIGQAEAWLDRRIVPSLAGPETERMMGMLVTDIALFVEAGISHIFATKEHAILSNYVIVEPVPSLFNAD